MQQDNQIINNSVTLVGKIASDYVFSHEVYGEGFYNFDVEVPRLSDAVDILPVTISERLLDAETFKIGATVSISGQIRTYNNYSQAENRNRLILKVFVRDFEVFEDAAASEELSPNEAFLNGYICKQPVYRTTPFGREIADLLIAVNRSYNKSDYIPCIAWGRNARFTGRLEVGDNIKIWGRMQSRVYQKKLDDGASIDRVAYEVSVSKLEQVAKE